MRARFTSNYIFVGGGVGVGVGVDRRPTSKDGLMTMRFAFGFGFGFAVASHGWMDGMRARFRRPRCGRRRQKCNDVREALLAPHVDSRIFGAAIARVRRSTRTGGNVIDASRTICSEKRIDDANCKKIKRARSSASTPRLEDHGVVSETAKRGYGFELHFCRRLDRVSAAGADDVDANDDAFAAI